MMENKLKTFKEWEFVKQFIYNSFLAIFIVLIAIIITKKCMSLRFDEVLSNSMFPDFKKGDIVVVAKQDSYKVGDTIEYQKGESLAAHEIVAYDAATGIYTTRGKFYGAPDDATITKDKINGKVVVVWTDGAFVYHMIKDNYLVLLTIVIGAWAISYILSNELEARKHNILKV